MNGSDNVHLCREDARALDALVEQAFNVNAVPARHQPRAEKLMDVLELLEHTPAANPGDILVHQTLTRVSRARQQERFTQQIQQLGGSSTGGPGFRLGELVAAAAVVLISVSLIWPVLARSRAGSQQFACKQNLAAAGRGMIAYGQENAGFMPAMASRAGSTWWNVGKVAEDGKAQSNSQHLMVLVRNGHVTLKDLSCPANPHAMTRARQGNLVDWPDMQSISFSYQNQFTPSEQRIDGRRRIAVLADKNPLIWPGEYRADLPATALSPNHHTLGGQNVLLTTGNVVWMPTPVLEDGDNIWQVKGTFGSTGTEVPLDPDDSHLVP